MKDLTELTYNESIKAWKDFIRDYNISIKKDHTKFKIDDFKQSIKDIFEETYKKESQYNIICASVVYSIILTIEDNGFKAYKNDDTEVNLYSLAILFLTWYGESIG